ncbi:hypothetical protein [Microbacterium sp. 13-71-7]|jgi:hypothetical protein|uniref:hypothetical protein n=1 Tax=Microbacterium sp. 13-71-7 TaxID=1970399 RepID=UPI000BCA460E|nr:hypothetical protein [Microbacterium sp. 13-71-7]OZB85817.1 MAG: hypothetical protein B7X32_02045 [Microbacterium sp. 13-71-7]
MSTDDADRPLTRAELRARRAAEEAADAVEPATPEQPSAPELASAPEVTATEVAAPEAARAAEAPAAPGVPAVPPADEPVTRSAAPAEVFDRAPGPRRTPNGGSDPSPILVNAPEAEVDLSPVPAAEAVTSTDAEPVVDGVVGDASSGPRLEAPEWQPHPSPAPSARRRRFPLVLGAVIGVLVVVVATFGVITLLQGPRISGVKIDAQSAIDASGTRMIITASQPLAKVDPKQVSVSPQAPFTVDTSGRNLGIRFTVPLDDDTNYTVTVKDATGTDKQRQSTLQASFQTPKSTIFLLQRKAKGDDTIFITDLGGKNAVPVVQHAKIDDFRATADHLVVATEKDGISELLVMDRKGKNQRELKLPGPGFLSNLQISERGNLVGYTFTDKGISATSGRASILVTQSLTGDGEPQIVKIGDKMPSISQWAFVPDSSSVLFIDFSGALFVQDRADTKAAPTALGSAQTVEGISRGTYTAIVSRGNDLVELNLADGSEKPLAASTPDFGVPGTIAPFPGGTLRQVATRDASGLPTGQIVTRVGDDGKATKLFSVTGSDAIMQACPSPSGQYSAIVVAPKLVNNPYDQSLLPLPTTMQTHIVDTKTGKELVVLAGFDPSWCAQAPHR